MSSVPGNGCKARMGGDAMSIDGGQSRRRRGQWRDAEHLAPPPSDAPDWMSRTQSHSRREAAGLLSHAEPGTPAALELSPDLPIQIHWISSPLPFAVGVRIGSFFHIHVAVITFFVRFRINWQHVFVLIVRICPVFHSFINWKTIISNAIWNGHDYN